MSLKQSKSQRLPRSISLSRARIPVDGLVGNLIDVIAAATPAAILAKTIAMGVLSAGSISRAVERRWQLESGIRSYHFKTELRFAQQGYVLIKIALSKALFTSTETNKTEPPFVRLKNAVLPNTTPVPAPFSKRCLFGTKTELPIWDEGEFSCRKPNRPENSSFDRLGIRCCS
jgi:hypothetical protein